MKVLFVVTAFYPEQAIGSVRTTKFAKYLVRNGVEVSVISLAPAPWALRDEGLHFPELDSMQWIQIDQSLQFKRLFQKARNATVGNASAVGYVRPSGAGRSAMAVVKSSAQLAYTLLKSLDWVRQVKKHARNSMRGQRFDVIFCSYPSFSSPFAAHALSRAGYSGVVAIDFRDPVSYGSNNRFGALRFLEQRMLKTARMASFVSEGVMAKVMGGGPSEQIVRVITNGFDPDDARKIAPSLRIGSEAGVLRFAYVGALYGGKRDMTPFFRAARQALDTSGLDGCALELHYAGGEGELFTRQAAACGLEDNVVNHGRVSRAESLTLQESSDACLVTTWNSPEDKGILTGKVFEFFMLRKPVVAIVNGPLAGSELGEIIDRTGAGICAEDADPQDYPRLVSWIEEALRTKIETGTLPSSYTDQVNAFGFPALTADLEHAMTTAIGQRKRAS
jgi:glycosyltransferase involved in cell wall biosynthesis